MNEQNQTNNGWNTGAGNQPQPNIPQGQMPNNMQGYSQPYPPQPNQGMPTEGSYQNYNNPQPYAQPFPYQPQPAAKKKTGLWVGLGIGGVVVVAALVIGILFVSGVISSKTKAEKLWSAILKSGEVTKSDTYQEWILDELKGGEGQPESGMYTELLNGAGLKLRTKSDLAESKIEADFRIYLKSMELLDIAYQQQNQDQIFSIPKLLSKSVYLSKEGLNSLLEDNGVMDSQAMESAADTFTYGNVQKSMKYLRTALNPVTLPEFKKLNKKKYLERVRDYYDAKIKSEKGSRKLTVGEEEKEFKGEVYEIHENVAEAAEFYLQLTKDLLADENFKPFVEAYLERLIAEIEANQDLLIYNYLQLISGSHHLKSAWDDEVKSELVYAKELILDVLDKAVENMDKPHADAEAAHMISALKDSATLDMIFVVDKQQVIYAYAGVKMDLQKAAETILQEESPIQSIKYHVATGVLATGDNVKFAAFEPDKAWDYAKATPEDMGELMAEVQTNAMQVLSSLGLF